MKIIFPPHTLRTKTFGPITAFSYKRVISRRVTWWTGLALFRHLTFWHRHCISVRDFLGGTLWEEFFGRNSLGILCGILWELLMIIIYIFKSQLVSYIFKVSWLFTLKSADFLHSKSQLITKSYFNMEGIDLFVKFLVFVKFLSYLMQGRKEDKI